MDYVLWENDRDEGEALIYGGWPHSLTVSFLTGQPLTGAVPHIEIVMDARSQGVLTDNLIVMGGPHVFSQKLLRVLTEQGVDNIQAYPCTVRNSVTNETHANYAVANIIGRVSCIKADESSVVRASGDASRLLAFDYLTLDEQRVRGLPLFLLAEMPVQIVLHRRIATALERADISGVRFVEQGSPKGGFPPIRG